MSDGSATSSRRWSGWSASTLPAQPIRRVVVSLPAPAMTVTYVRISSRREPAGRSRLVLELGVQQLGHQVVGGVFGPPVDVVGEDLAAQDRRPAELVIGFAGLGARATRRRARGSPPGPAPGSRAACRSPASASARRDRRRSRTGRRRRAGRGSRAQNSRTCGSSAFIFLGVNTRDSSPRCTVWIGGSSKMMTPGGISMFGLDQLEDRATPGDVGLAVLAARARRRRSG